MTIKVGQIITKDVDNLPDYYVAEVYEDGRVRATNINKVDGKTETILILGDFEEWTVIREAKSNRSGERNT